MEHKLTRLAKRRFAPRPVYPVPYQYVLTLDWLIAANSCLFLYSDVSMSKVLLAIKGDDPLRMI